MSNTHLGLHLQTTSVQCGPSVAHAKALTELATGLLSCGPKPELLLLTCGAQNRYAAAARATISFFTGIPSLHELPACLTADSLFTHPISAFSYFAVALLPQLQAPAPARPLVAGLLALEDAAMETAESNDLAASGNTLAPPLCSARLQLPWKTPDSFKALCLAGLPLFNVHGGSAGTRPHWAIFQR